MSGELLVMTKVVCVGERWEEKEKGLLVTDGVRWPALPGGSLECGLLVGLRRRASLVCRNGAELARKSCE